MKKDISVAVSMLCEKMPKTMRTIQESFDVLLR